MNSQKNDSHAPLLIAGPCSAETREQVLKTAHALKDAGLKYFRAGIWKPRTRPGDFEGIGSEGLKWLQAVQQETGLAVCTEVANVRHVEECLEAGVDMLWIGARTTVNPFSVQEIAECLKGVKVPVFVKNPVNPDLKLWMGAVERFQNCGIENMGAIHRGFSTYEKTDYRNKPKWQIAIDFQNEFPEIPLICDPSHIAGNRTLIGRISQKALDLNYSGLMIETHSNPEEAWTDARQQVSPAEFIEIIANLIIRQANPADLSQSELFDLRSEINHLDDALVDILAKRMSISGMIGKFKKLNGMTILQNARWEELLQRNLARAQESGVSGEFICELFKLVHQESINIQEEVLLNKINELKPQPGSAKQG